MTDVVLMDDRTLIDEILHGAVSESMPSASLMTTSYWFFRSGRAAALGAAGQLSGPFERLDKALQAKAIQTLLALPEHVSLPDPRLTIPAMIDLASRHPQLNLLNLEAAAAAELHSAHVLLSPKASKGLLVGILDEQGTPWKVWAPMCTSVGRYAADFHRPPEIHVM